MAGDSPETIKKEDAEMLARTLSRKIEGHMYRMFDDEVRNHIIAQLSGILKGLYPRDDERLGHIGIERTIMDQKFEQAEKARRGCE
jgi:hypothetical protein